MASAATSASSASVRPSSHDGTSSEEGPAAGEDASGDVALGVGHRGPRGLLPLGGSHAEPAQQPDAVVLGVGERTLQLGVAPAHRELTDHPGHPGLGPPALGQLGNHPTGIDDESERRVHTDVEQQIDRVGPGVGFVVSHGYRPFSSVSMAGHTASPTGHVICPGGPN